MKSQVKGSKTAKQKPPSQHGNGGSIIEFTRQCRWWLCSAAMPKQYQAVLDSTKTRVQKPVPAIPTR